MTKIGVQLRKQGDGNLTHLSTDLGRGKVITSCAINKILSYKDSAK